MSIGGGGGGGDVDGRGSQSEGRNTINEMRPSFRELDFIAIYEWI